MIDVNIPQNVIIEYDHDIPQLHSADQPRHCGEEQQNTNSHKTPVKQPAFSFYQDDGH